MPVLNGIGITQANQVWDGYRITGRVLNYLVNSNPTFRRCYFDVGYTDGTCVLHPNGRGWGTITVEDCEYNGQGPTNGTSAGPFGNLANQAFVGAQVNANDTTIVRRCDIHNSVHGIDVFSGYTVEKCYIHDIAYFWGDSSGGVSITHSDGLQLFHTASNGINLHDIRVVNNNIDCSATPALNAPWQFGGWATGLQFTDIEISGNYFDGTSFNALHGSIPTDATVTRCYIRNNRYGLTFKGGDKIISPEIKTSAMWSTGNVWDRSGTTVGGMTAVAGQPI